MAFANLATRNNVALEIESQGFSNVRAAARDPGNGVRDIPMSDDAFTLHRSLLFTVAYEMLGSASDAEDVVQETWLRWAGVGHDEVRDTRACLVRIVTRQALNRLRTLARRREDYVGEWLPEPVLTGPDVGADLELAESVSMAMLTVLETLGPVERAVFVLHDVFETPFEEIAEALGRSPATVRQIAHRAREHVAARRPRMPVSRTEQEEVVERFLDVLAPDVVLVADGGGIAAAVRQPIKGAELVTNVVVRVGGLRGLEAKSVWLNGSPAARIDVDGRLDTALSLTVENGRITRIYAVRNPQKLAGLDEVAPLTRT